jgi:enoyl-CoA hydratase/carnithine racemase
VQGVGALGPSPRALNSYDAGVEFTEIEYDVADNIATIALNRPEKMNAGTATMVRELVTVLDLVDGDDDVRAVVLTGRGKAFCAGADLSGGGETFAHGGPGGTEAAPERPGRDGAGLVTMRLFECTKPVITAVNGAAVGMGATIPLATDIRLAGESARFGFVFARRGIVPEGASAWFLPRVVGVSQAAEWLYTGRVFGAAEALAGRLVRSVHPDAELLDAARELAVEIADSAPVSVALTRRMLWRGLVADHPMYAHRVDSRAVRYTGKQTDAIEGVTSFLEKRPAQFTGSVSAGLPDIFPDWIDPEFS